MSGNRYFSELSSKLTFRRISPAEGSISEETKEAMLAEAKAANLSEGLLKLMERELTSKQNRPEKLTSDEVAKIEERIRLLDMVYYGVQVSENGIFFEGTQEGNLYNPAADLMSIFNSVKDTVLFDGVVEVWAIDIDDYSCLEIKDSVVVSEKSAEIHWV